MVRVDSASDFDPDEALAILEAEMGRQANIIRTVLHTLKPGEMPAPLEEHGADLRSRFLEARALYRLGERL